MHDYPSFPNQYNHPSSVAYSKALIISALCEERLLSPLCDIITVSILLMLLPLSCGSGSHVWPEKKTSIICYVFVKLETLKAMLLRSYSKKVGLPNKSLACVCKLCITDPCLWTFPWIIHSCFLQNTPFYIPLNLKPVFLSPSLLSGDCSLFFIFLFWGCAGLCVTDIPR